MSDNTMIIDSNYRSKDPEQCANIEFLAQNVKPRARHVTSGCFSILMLKLKHIRNIMPPWQILVDNRISC